MENAIASAPRASMTSATPRSVGTAWDTRAQPSTHVVLVVGVIENGDQREADGIAGIVELHQHVADAEADLAVFVAGDLPGDPLGKGHEMLRHSGPVVAQAKPRREGLPAHEGHVAPNRPRGMHGAQDVGRHREPWGARLGVLVVSEP